jgi:hypothetical protein
LTKEPAVNAGSLETNGPPSYFTPPSSAVREDNSLPSSPSPATARSIRGGGKKKKDGEQGEGKQQLI